MLKSLLLTLCIHIALLFFLPKTSHQSTIDRDAKRQEKPIKVTLSSPTPNAQRREAKPNSSRLKKISMSQLKFSHKLFKKTSKDFNPSKIDSVDPGGTKRSCLRSLLSSSVTFPDLIFQNQISGVAGLNIIIKKKKIIIQQQKSGHPLLSKLLCFNLKEQILKVKRFRCLRQTEIRGLHRFNVTYTYGQKPYQELKVGSRNYSVFLQRIKKSSPIRALMAISNIFTLLELYQSREAKAIDQTFLLNLQKLDCRRHTIFF